MSDASIIAFPEELIDGIARNLGTCDILSFMKASKQAYRIGYPILLDNLTIDEKLAIFKMACEKNQTIVLNKYFNDIVVASKDDRKYGDGAIDAASTHGHVALVQSLLAQGVAVDTTDDYIRRKPLELAVQGDHAEVAKVLLDAGANLYSPYPWDERAERSNPGFGYQNVLAIAAQCGAAKVIRMLFEYSPGLDVNRLGGRCTVLYSAVYGRHADAVRALIDHGADVEIGEERQYADPSDYVTPILRAARNNDPRTSLNWAACSDDPTAIDFWRRKNRQCQAWQRDAVARAVPESESKFCDACQGWHYGAAEQWRREGRDYSDAWESYPHPIHIPTPFP
ncbi:ankyrin repeat-containing domain protein [Aspergillus crustosus]